jgi:hypothetical protein
LKLRDEDEIDEDVNVLELSRKAGLKLGNQPVSREENNGF